jgi:hypothetical protein
MKLTYDEKSFILDQKRIWLADGEVHYFRHPRESWREVLLRAKRAGLNCISTYVAWNFHEPEKGKYDFSGDKDIGYFIDLIGELGMFAMLRPGPYICSEWDCGGIPAWVCNKHGIRTREDDPLYMEEMEPWFDQLLPILVSRQITKGGPIITIQNENEYCGGWDESTRNYIKKITGMFRKHGFEIPVLGCNAHANSAHEVQINGKTNPEDQIIDKDLIITYNCGTDVGPVYDLRKKQPYAPVIVTELWSGAQSMWGRMESDWPEKTLQTRMVYDFTSSGAQVCYYMFEGGTNFGYWAGEYIVTSYQSAYPVGDGGVLREKYYMLKQVNHFITGFGDFLAESEEIPGANGMQGPEGVRLVLRKSQRGSVLFVSLADQRKSIDVNLGNGKTLEICFGDVSATAVPVCFEALPGFVLDYANLALFTCCKERNMVVFYGSAGIEGTICINGVEYTAPVKRNDITLLKIGSIAVLIVDEKMARRYWDVEGHLFFGPDFAGEVQDDGSIPLRISPATERIFYITECGEILPVPFTAPLLKFTPPGLPAWKSLPCEELSIGDTGWNNLDVPCSHEDLGVDLGYVWYRAELESEEEEVRELCFTNTPNRVSLFVNGTFCGTYGEKRTKSQRLGYEHPVDFRLENISVPLRKGKNCFVFLSDNQGHDYGMFIPKGITGPVFAGVRKIGMENLECRDSVPVSDTAYKWLYCSDYKQNIPLAAIEFDLELRPGERGYITLHDVPSWITVNGEELPPLIYPLNVWNMWPHAASWNNYVLPLNEKGGRYKIRVSFRFKPYQYVLDKMQCFAVRQSGQLTNWAWKPFHERMDFSGCRNVITNAEKKNDQIVLLVPSVSSGAIAGQSFTPAFYEAGFPMPEGEQPVFLAMGDMQKGQLYLNGHNIGRFWQVGGVNTRYYLPREWMNEENQLVIFEELGIQPQRTALVFGEEQPFNSYIGFKPEM